MSADLAALAERAARDAGALLLTRFREPARGVESKRSGTDMVSDADRDSEALILSILRDARPGDGILAEEGGGTPSESGFTWIVDPLDGTTNFLYGIPQFCVSIAVADDEGPVAGVVHDPCRDETFIATRGGGATLNDESIECSAKDDLATALLATGFSYLAEERAEQGRVIAALLPRVRDVRRLGSAALDLCWTAAGRFDAFVETGLAPWDRAAGALIAAEAGCELSWLEPIGPSGRGLAVSGTALHPALSDELTRRRLTLSR